MESSFPFCPLQTVATTPTKHSCQRIFKKSPFTWNPLLAWGCQTWPNQENRPVNYNWIFTLIAAKTSGEMPPRPLNKCVPLIEVTIPLGEKGSYFHWDQQQHCQYQHNHTITGQNSVFDDAWHSWLCSPIWNVSLYSPYKPSSKNILRICSEPSPNFLQDTNRFPAPISLIILPHPDLQKDLTKNPCLQAHKANQAPETSRKVCDSKSSNQEER